MSGRRVSLDRQIAVVRAASMVAASYAKAAKGSSASAPAAAEAEALRAVVATLEALRADHGIRALALPASPAREVKA